LSKCCSAHIEAFGIVISKNLGLPTFPLPGVSEDIFHQVVNFGGNCSCSIICDILGISRTRTGSQFVRGLYDERLKARETHNVIRKSVLIEQLVIRFIY
jgi:hypothetical protein